MRGLWDKRGKVHYKVLWSNVNDVMMYVCTHISKNSKNIKPWPMLVSVTVQQGEMSALAQVR